jgi:hypothetical protein
VRIQSKSYLTISSQRTHYKNATSPPHHRTPRSILSMLVLSRLTDIVKLLPSTEYSAAAFTQWLNAKYANKVPHLDQRRYNHPTASEVAVIMVGNGEDGATERDLVLHARDGSFRSISYLKSFYIPLRYPILFVHGEQGWHPNIYLHYGYLSFPTSSSAMGH